MMDSGALQTDPRYLFLLVNALVDGELDAATTLALERHLEADRALAAEEVSLIALKQAVGLLPRPSVSPEFYARIASLAPQQTTAARSPVQKRTSFDWRAMAASIVVTAFLASSVTYWQIPSNPPPSIADAIAGSHRQAMLAASPIDILSSDRHTVKPWLDARIGVSPPTVDLSADGFSLLGGRVDVIAGAPVPALVYRYNEHLITVVALPRRQGTEEVAGAAPLSADGFNLVHWTDSAFSYWATSDMEKDELAAFVAHFRALAAAG
jgi:anti-sigma factor RsiW